MGKHRLIVATLFSFLFLKAQAQKDSLSNDAVFDTSVDYDVLFSELDAFLDSLLAPRSFTLINISAHNNEYVYRKGNKAERKERFTVTPFLGYYNKNGLGINGTATFINETEKVLPYQYSLTGSYDYLKNFDFSTGIAATRFFTKKEINFYTSPLENEVYTYFAYRTFWLKPTVSARYGWAAEPATPNSKVFRDALLPLPLPSNGSGNNNVAVEESINDFTVNLSLRHDFYWLDVFSNNSFIRLSPQVSLTGGTQKYGFNKSSSSYGLQQVVQNNVLLPIGSVQVSEKTAFAPLSAAASLRGEVNVGKFFVQPQILVNYYIPESSEPLLTMFNINTGLIF